MFLWPGCGHNDTQIIELGFTSLQDVQKSDALASDTVKHCSAAVAAETADVNLPLVIWMITWLTPSSIETGDGEHLPPQERRERLPALQEPKLTQRCLFRKSQLALLVE